MLRKKAANAPASHPPEVLNQPITLKMLADYLRLSPATVSLVINRSPAADSIPQRTQERVLTAARKFNYRPNIVARSLRKQRRSCPNCGAELWLPKPRARLP